VLRGFSAVRATLSWALECRLKRKSEVIYQSKRIYKWGKAYLKRKSEEKTLRIPLQAKLYYIR
jgi:transposase